MARYIRFSRSAYYGVVAAIPLLVAYELLLAAGAGAAPVAVRNAADAWLRMVLAGFGLRPSQVTLGMILVLILCVPLLRRAHTPLHWRYLLLMLLEATAYSLVLGLLIQGILHLLLAPLLRDAGVDATTALQMLLPSGVAAGGPLAQGGWSMESGRMQALALSLGAGLFEEFVFRVLLLGMLMAVLRLVFAGWLCAALSIVTAAFLFALAHHVGPLGEPLTAQAFLFRWVAGLLFTLLYYARGFGVTAYAHALYDIRILLF